MLLDLCDSLTVNDDVVTAELNANAVPMPEASCGEQGYPAFLLAEAFAQIACRTAQKLIPLEGRRYLPATTKTFEINGHINTDLGGLQLVATPQRLRPLPEFHCKLVGRKNNLLATATVIVAPAPELHS